ncbi:MAG: hypothetical protein LBG61_05555 [Burkholderiales bacterium]|jgi:hypothetical protein|nr:hypothetical protein [Burkholderiales bacterium]
MKKSLRAYLSECDTTLSDATFSRDRVALRLFLERHQDNVAAFQHERLVHLIVTLFFAFLLIVAFAGTLWQPSWAFLALDAVIAVTLLFYIQHYFFLENNVQKLYTMTERIYRLLNDTKGEHPSK